MLLNTFLWCIIDVSKNSLSFNMSSASAITFIKCQNRYHMKNNIRYKGNINNTSLIFFLIASRLNKTPSDDTCLGEPPGGFCDVGYCFLTSLEVSHFIAFPCHPSPFRELSTGFSTHSYRECYSFEWAIFARIFYPTLPRFMIQIRAGTPHPGSSSVPALTELSLPADAWTWTIDLGLSYKTNDLSIAPVSHEA